MYVKLLEDYPARHPIIQAETLLQVEKITDETVAVRRGIHYGYVIPRRFIEQVDEWKIFQDQNQELLQRREEVQKLMLENEELRKQLEQRKPVLSREVAEALESAKKWSGASGIELIPYNIPHHPKGDYWEVLYKHSDVPGGYFEIIDALRYGYTIADPYAGKKDNLIELFKDQGFGAASAGELADKVMSIVLAEGVDV